MVLPNLEAASSYSDGVYISVRNNELIKVDLPSPVSPKQKN